MILVLDDYHLIEAQSIHDALNFLLENQPPNFSDLPPEYVPITMLVQPDEIMKVEPRLL